MGAQSCINPEDSLNYRFLPFHGSLVPFCCLFWDIKPPVIGRRSISMSCHWSYKIGAFSCPLQQSIYLPCLALSTSVTWGFLQELTSMIILGRSWASRNSWDLVVVWERPVRGQQGALVGKGVHCVYVEEEWLLKNEVMGPGSALRDYGNHWPERGGVTFMQKWLRSGTVLQPLWG